MTILSEAASLPDGWPLEANIKRSPTVRILLTGSSGLIGTVVQRRLTREGHTVMPLVRHRPTTDELRWDPNASTLDSRMWGQVDAVIHLAGEGISGKSSTKEQMDTVVMSRIRGTQLLAQTIAKLPVKPVFLISASAIAYYGERGNEVLTEESKPGAGALADVCRQWEATSAAASDAGVRVALLRLGVVLDSNGGLLPKMLPPFRLGLGGKVGSGNQWTSWITLNDICGIVMHLIQTDGLSGPVNVVSPQPITNTQLTSALGRALGKPAILPIPAFAARATLGRIADELLLASNRVIPNKLLSSGYAFRDSDIESALRSLLGDPS